MTEQDNRRVWIPEEYLDEVTPPGRASPSEWIEDNVAGRALAPAWDFEKSAPIALERGQVVNFYWCDTHGHVLIRLQRDGSFKILSGAVEPAATHFWRVGDPESLADTLEEFAKQEAQSIPGGEDIADIDVQMATWSEGGVPHALVVEGNSARFVQVAGLH